MDMDCFELSSESPYELLLKDAFLIPFSHYLLAFLFLFSAFLYHFLEIHFFQDLFTAFRGQPVSLTYNSCCDLYQEVVSKCKTLNDRFSSTPWLCSPHLQTAFLQFFGRAPVCNYQRQIFHMSDGGTIALDWLRNVDVEKPSIGCFNGVQSDDKSPIMVVIPGLTSDSDSAYIKHLAFKMAKCGWNVVVSNHRGLGGVSVTSDCFYNAGWTEDVRKVIDHLYIQYPHAPLFAVGLSIGANVLVKYLGEEGVNTAIVGAAAICSPWDLLICDRYINRRLVQRFYDRALTIGLKDYAKRHQTVMSRLADWEAIVKSHSVRDFDNHFTCVLADLEVITSTSGNKDVHQNNQTEKAKQQDDEWQTQRRKNNKKQPQNAQKNQVPAQQNKVYRPISPKQTEQEQQKHVVQQPEAPQKSQAKDPQGIDLSLPQPHDPSNSFALLSDEVSGGNGIVEVCTTNLQEGDPKGGGGLSHVLHENQIIDHREDLRAPATTLTIQNQCISVANQEKFMFRIRVLVQHLVCIINMGLVLSLTLDRFRFLVLIRSNSFWVIRRYSRCERHYFPSSLLSIYSPIMWTPKITREIRRYSRCERHYFPLLPRLILYPNCLLKSITSARFQPSLCYFFQLLT